MSVTIDKSNKPKREKMLDNLKDLFKEGLGYPHIAGILQQVANLVNIVHTQYTKDSDAKNAAIDIICAILQTHKDVPVVEKPVVPVEAQNASS